MDLSRKVFLVWMHVTLKDTKSDCSFKELDILCVRSTENISWITELIVSINQTGK